MEFSETVVARVERRRGPMGLGLEVWASSTSSDVDHVLEAGKERVGEVLLDILAARGGNHQEGWHTEAGGENQKYEL